MIPEKWSMTKRVFSHFGPMFTPLPPPSPLRTQRIKSLKKWKKSARDIIVLHKCTINDNHMIYGSWDINCNRQIFFVILGHFWSFYPPNSPKNDSIRKMKTPGDIIILHEGTKTHNHRLQCSWDMVRDGCNCCFSFWAILCTFTPLTTQKMKISKKMKKNAWRYHHFTQVYQIWFNDFTCPTGSLLLSRESS